MVESKFNSEFWEHGTIKAHKHFSLTHTNISNPVRLIWLISDLLRHHLQFWLTDQQNHHWNGNITNTSINKSFKGIVQPKITILSSFISWSCSKLLWLYSVEHKRSQWSPKLSSQHISKQLMLYRRSHTGLNDVCEEIMTELSFVAVLMPNTSQLKFKKEDFSIWQVVGCC